MRCRNKIRYRNKLEAKIALMHIAKIDRPSANEKRAYKCNFCRGWHLTSQDKHE